MTKMTNSGVATLNHWRGMRGAGNGDAVMVECENGQFKKKQTAIAIVMGMFPKRKRDLPNEERSS